MTLTLIDTFGFFFRSYFAMPPLSSRSGHPTGLLTGFMNFISKLTSEDNHDAIVFCLESKSGSFREELYAAYKGNRPEAPEDFKKQLPIAIEWLEKMGFCTMSVDGYEADDIIATLASKAKADGHLVRIVTHDKDLYQLIDDGKVVVYDPSKKKTVDSAACVERFGVSPTNFVDFQALVGDSVDNVPGVKGIGEKGAAKLINEYGSIEQVYENLDSISGKSLVEKLTEGKESAFLSKALVTLEQNLPIEADMELFRPKHDEPLALVADEMLRYDIRAVLKKAKTNEPKSLLEKAEAVQQKTDNLPFEPILLSLKEQLFDTIAAIPEDAIVAFDTETDSLDTKKARLVGFSFAWKGDRGYYVPVGHSYLGAPVQIAAADAKEGIGRLFERKIIGQNLKFDLSLIYNLYGFERISPHADTMLLAWLLDPDGAVGLDALARRYLQHEMIRYSETVKAKEDFSSVDVGLACKYASEDAVMTLRLYDELKKQMRLKGCESFEEILRDLELPFIGVLIDMEREGIKVSAKRLAEIGMENDADIARLRDNIYELAGGEFNINSTQQLSAVLYDRLELSGGRKTKTGVSTDERSLALIEHEHPIVAAILDYRELFKLKSTYIEPLIKYANSDKRSRIYTSFLQTGTATGRLSSKNPNLQNIPVKTEAGRRIREAFVADEGKTLIGIDYSQIELRLLAHFSLDSTLVGAFRDGRDIHYETAKRIFGEELAAVKRGVAKTINFGLLYGMGSKKLSETLKISLKEAKELIEAYFASFPTVKNYLQSLKDAAKQSGYAETLRGRRRFFNFASANQRDEATYLREAVNTKFQGTAADIIKMAMLQISAEIKERKLPAAMVLQIHDELIFEADEHEAKALGELFLQRMQDVVALNVPLKCSLAFGKSWGALK